MICKKTTQSSNSSELENLPSFSLLITDELTTTKTPESDNSSGGYFGGDQGSDDDDRKRRKGGRLAPPYLIGITSGGVQIASDLMGVTGIDLSSLPTDTPVYFQLAEMSDNSQLLIVISDNQYQLFRRSSMFSEPVHIDTVHIYTLPDHMSGNTSPGNNKQNGSISREALTKALAAVMPFLYHEKSSSSVADNGPVPFNQAPLGGKSGKTSSRGGGGVINEPDCSAWHNTGEVASW